MLPGRLLRLRAEMRLPGLAWLELAVRPEPDGGSTLRQVATFHPHGLAGQLYWLLVSPFHGVVFGGMQHGMKAEAERRVRAAGAPTAAAAAG